MLTSISHDLRTPLASILGAAASLRAYGADLTESAKHDLAGVIHDEAERLNRFIANLLDMTRLESGEIRLRCESIDIADIVGSALARAKTVLQMRKVRMEIDRVHTADAQRAGTGLGLSIARGFVEAMGGTLVAANRGDTQGAVFTVKLLIA